MKQVIEFLLFPQFSGLSVSGPLEVFHTANRILLEESNRSRGYRFRFTAQRKGVIGSEAGLAFNAEADIRDNPPADILLIPGGLGVRHVLKSKELLDYIRTKADQTYRILAISRGVLIPARAGLLENRRAAAPWQIRNRLSQHYPGVEMDFEELFVQDDNLWTAAGISGGMDIALSVIEEDFGSSLAMEVSRQLQLYYKRPEKQSLYISLRRSGSLVSERFKPLHNWLGDHLQNSRLSIDEMACQAGMSPRNFARVFKQEVYVSPAKYLEELRLDRARSMLVEGSGSLEKIAADCGFGMEERLRRAFARQYGITPSQFRIHYLKDNEEEEV